jgi:hypothetical protein
MEVPEPEEAEIHASEFPPIIDGHLIDRTKIVLPDPIIENLLSITEKLELVGGSKMFKTWSLIDMALSVANGVPWWGRQTFKTHVVYLNMELNQPFFEQRLFEVADAKQVVVPAEFHAIHLRGAKLHDRTRWEKFLKYLDDHLPRFPHPLLISDPIYKMLGGKNENSAGDINAMMDQLEDLVQRTEGANAFGHHQAKGNQSDKEAIDRSSGSGVFQRDPDTLLPMTTHENDKCFTVSPILRNHPPINDFVLEWKSPLFTPRHDLDPQSLKQKPSPGHTKYSVQLLVTLLGQRSLRTKAFEKRAREESGMVASTFHVFLRKAEKAKLIAKDLISEEWQVIKTNP